MRCPGQDRSFWTGEVTFEAPCPKCDARVEFFKDETSGRCANCGHRFRNPRVSFDCAQWCSFAEECLGFVPERLAVSDPGKGALASRLIKAIKDEFDTQQDRIAKALGIFRQAAELLSKEGGDPRIILAAALLLETATDGAEDLATARQILRDVGLDQNTADCVCHLIDSHRLGKPLGTIESQIVADSEFLAKLAAAKHAGGNPQRLLQLAEDRLKTESGKRRARHLLRIPPQETGD